MVYDFEDDYYTIRALVDDGVEESPERREVLDEKVPDSVLLSEGLGDRSLLDHFTVEAIVEQNHPEFAGSAGDARRFLPRGRIEHAKRLGRVRRD